MIRKGDDHRFDIAARHALAQGIERQPTGYGRIAHGGTLRQLVPADHVKRSYLYPR